MQITCFSYKPFDDDNDVEEYDGVDDDDGNDNYNDCNDNDDDCNDDDLKKEKELEIGRNLLKCRTNLSNYIDDDNHNVNVNNANVEAYGCIGGVSYHVESRCKFLWSGCSPQRCW